MTRIFVGLLITVFALTACVPGNPPRATTAACLNTVRVGILQDKSASSTPNGVYQIRPDDVRSPAERIIRCGGELALGIVGDPSGAPLHRWSVDAAEEAPVAPPSDATAINGAIDNAAYETQLSEWKARDDARIARARQQLDAFVTEITPLLSRKPEDPKTPLWLALARVDSFLGEPDTFPLPSHRYLVLSSDGINTTGSPTALTSGAALFISNGSQAIGSLDKLSFTVVENPVGAFRKIIDLENAHASNKS